jgi:hypothetical protein
MKYGPVVVIVIGVPPKLAMVAAFAILVTPGKDVGKPVAVATTDVPAGPVDGDRLTAGAVMVNVAAIDVSYASDITTWCGPGARFKEPGPPITMYPLR